MCEAQSKSPPPSSPPCLGEWHNFTHFTTMPAPPPPRPPFPSSTLRKTTPLLSICHKGNGGVRAEAWLRVPFFRGGQGRGRRRKKGALLWEVAVKRTASSLSFFRSLPPLFPPTLFCIIAIIFFSPLQLTWVDSVCIPFRAGGVREI